MAKIDLTKQARAPQNPGQVLKVSAVTSSVTGLYEWTTGVDSDSQTRSNGTSRSYYIRFFYFTYHQVYLQG